MNAETSRKPAAKALPQSAYMKNLSADSVDAQIVQMHQSGASKVTADSVEAADSFLGEVKSQTATIQRGLTGFVKTEQAAIDHGFSGVINSHDMVVNGTIGVTLAQSVRMTESKSGFVIAREVHGGKMHTVFLLTTRMDAPVETVVEPRSIALFGAAAGLTFGLVYGLFRWLRS